MVRIVLALLVLLLLVVLFRGVFRPIVVYEFERGLRYARGKFKGIVEPGFYWSIQPLSEVRKVDIRPVFAAVAGQEVLSSDGVALKVSLAAKYEVADPAVAINKVENFRDALHVELQLDAGRSGPAGRPRRTRESSGRNGGSAKSRECGPTRRTEPHLMQLRLLQVLGQQSGNTVVLGMQPPSVPIPIRQSGEGTIETQAQGSGEREGDV